MASPRKTIPAEHRPRVDEARALLAANDLDASDRGALTLLALLHLAPSTPWGQAQNPKLGVAEIMDFIDTSYGVRYAPNSRESIRKDSLRPLLDAGWLIPNPGAPRTAKSSQDYSYQLTADRFDWLRRHDQPGWSADRPPRAPHRLQLESLHLRNVGPAPEMELHFAPRLNLITGDNGLGKSFLLDVAWWALTRKWPHDLNPKLTSGYAARPTDSSAPATIGIRLDANGKSVEYLSTYAPRDEAWVGKAGRPWNPGLVIYAHADGGFSLWDPARNYWKKKGNIDVQERLPGYVFAALEVWDGLIVDVDGKPTKVCNGLIDDWSVWIREKGDSAARMAQVLDRLAPRGEPIAVGPLLRLGLNEVRYIPSIKTAYGQDVPILHASAGLRRILGLAYMLLWSWNEHRLAAKQLGEEPTRQVILLFDELESHLHPRWQRSILASVMHVAESLHSETAVQLLVATHSPLVLASAEPTFDAAKDAWFDLDLDPGTTQVQLRRRDFVRHGDVSNWLTSEAFDLKSARSLEAETAIEKARALLRTEKPDPHAARVIDEELRRAGLPDIDPFWVRWGHFVEGLGGSA